MSGETGETGQMRLEFVHWRHGRQLWDVVMVGGGGRHFRKADSSPLHGRLFMLGMGGAVFTAGDMRRGVRPGLHIGDSGFLLEACPTCGRPLVEGERHA